MYKQESKRVLAVVNDLFFSVKITDAAKRNGLELEFVKQSEAVMQKALQKPSLIVLDLNFEAVLKKIHEIMKIHSCNIHLEHIDVNMSDLYVTFLFL